MKKKFWMQILLFIFLSLFARFIRRKYRLIFPICRLKKSEINSNADWKKNYFVWNACCMTMNVCRTYRIHVCVCACDIFNLWFFEVYRKFTWVFNCDILYEYFRTEMSMVANCLPFDFIKHLIIKVKLRLRRSFTKNYYTTLLKLSFSSLIGKKNVSFFANYRYKIHVPSFRIYKKIIFDLGAFFLRKNLCSHFYSHTFILSIYTQHI